MNNDFFHTVIIPLLEQSYYLSRAYSYLSEHFPGFFHFLQNLIGLLIGLSIPVSLFFLIGTLVSVFGLKSIRMREDKKYNHPPIDMAYDETVEADYEMAKRWDVVMKHAGSDNVNDLRQSIIEADIMLGDMLVKMGYQGETIGEQLQRVARGDFKSLEKAREAHWVRNRIAHDGANFDLSKHEAQRIIGLYKEVFSEFFDIK